MKTEERPFAVGDRVASPSGTAVVREVRDDEIVIEYENPRVFGGSNWPTTCWEYRHLLQHIDVDAPVLPMTEEKEDCFFS